MGGSSKKQTVGYKYYLGMHMALCHGPVDKLIRIQVDNRDAWLGAVQHGQITVNAPNLFGGEKREGGVSGAIDFDSGKPDQGQNAYLASKLGALVPNFRGVAAAVLRQVYVGMNPYLKSWAFRLQRIHTRQNGLAQWYDAKAEIASGALMANQAICFCVDFSQSQLQEVSPGITRASVMKAALQSALEYIRDNLAGTNGLDIAFIPFSWRNTPDFDSHTRLYYNTSSSQIDSMISTMLATPFIVGTAYDGPLIKAQAFFNAVPSTRLAKTLIFITDGETVQRSTDSATVPYTDYYGQIVYQGPYYGMQQSTDFAVIEAAKLWNAGVSIHAFNTASGVAYTSQLDNSSGDGVPVLTGANPDAITDAIIAALPLVQQDMNPAHIIRECLTDLDWGMGYPEADMDDAAFMAAADTLHAEGMGISVLWDRQTPLEDFIKEILKHIDAVLYVSRTTGKFVLRLIRADYNTSTLLVLDENNVERVDNYKTPAIGELVNSVTVKFWDTVTGKDASVSAQDIALAQLQGAAINIAIDYPGFTNSRIANRVAVRDLRTLSTPLASCTIYANRAAAGLNVGDAFKLDWPDYGVSGVVMRVTQIAYGDGKNNRVRITCTQDVFGLPEAINADTPPTEWVDPNDAPAPSPHQLVIEAPYYELVQRMGADEINTELANYPERGYLLVVADRPGGAALNAQMWVDAGAGYAEAATLDFSPHALLAGDVSQTSELIDIVSGVDLDLVTVGTHAQMGNELVKITSVSTSQLGIKRGILDTVPALHLAGESVFFWDVFAATNEVEYALGETISAKVLPVTAYGALDISAAPAGQITLSRRASRPYPPGNFKVNAQYYPAVIAGDLSFTWAHRDRLQQTDGDLLDHTYGNIGPETGVTYTVRIYNAANTLLRTASGLTDTFYDYPMVNESADSGGELNSVLRAEIESARAANYGYTWTQIGGGGVNGTWNESTKTTLRHPAVLTVAGRTDLYVGTTGSTNDAELWRWDGSAWLKIGGDGAYGSWSGFENVTKLVALAGKLYASVGRASGSAEIWEWNGTLWTRIGYPSVMGSITSYQQFQGLSVHSGALYAAAIGGAGDADVWRWNGGTSWTQIGGDGLNSGWAAGVYEYAIAGDSVGGYLYMGLGNSAGDGEVWRYSGTVWAKVGGDGVNSSWSSANIARSMANDGTNLYVGLNTPTEVWKWSGSAWTKIAGGGLNGSWGAGVHSEVVGLFFASGKLYAGLASISNTTDGELWEFDLVSNLWAKIAGQGLNASPDRGQYEGLVFNGQKYAFTASFPASSTAVLVLRLDQTVADPGTVSWQKQTATFDRAGFGVNFGNYYGGI